MDSEQDVSGAGGIRRHKLTFAGEEELVDDDVVSVDLVGGKLLDESFRLVEGEEFGDADSNEGRLVLKE